MKINGIIINKTAFGNMYLEDNITTSNISSVDEGVRISGTATSGVLSDFTYNSTDQVLQYTGSEEGVFQCTCVLSMFVSQKDPIDVIFLPGQDGGDLGDPIDGGDLGDPIDGGDLGDPRRDGSAIDGGDLGDPIDGGDLGDPIDGGDLGASIGDIHLKSLVRGTQSVAVSISTPTPIRIGAYLAINTGGLTPLSPGEDRIKESTAYTIALLDTSTTDLNTQPIRVLKRNQTVSIQFIKTLSTNDRIYPVVENNSTTDDIVVELFNLVIRKI